MALLQACDPDVEVSTEAIMSLVKAMGPFKNNAIKLLAKHGISDLAPGKWYSQQECFDAFKDIPIKIGNNTLMLVGKNIFQYIQMPPGIDTIEKALMAVDDVFHAGFRNGEVGCYKFRQTGIREGAMFCSSPYPCSFDQGLLRAICNHFKPSDSKSVSIKHSDATVCRQTGSFACIYIINW